MSAIPPDPAVRARLADLAFLLENEARMLAELGAVAGVAPPARLAGAPLAAFSQVAAFVDATDVQAATEDARIWLHNRLGLFLARWFAARHGGRLVVQDEPGARFYLHIVLTDMEAPVRPGARLSPFAIAEDAIRAQPRIGLAALAGAAEAALTGA